MFRRARVDDREILDGMTLAGARYWGHDQNHPDAYQRLAQQVAAEPGPENHPVFVLEDDEGIVGFYELRDRDEHIELLRMFQRPDLIGQGYGRVLWNHAVEEAARTHDRMLIMSDPGATAFYAAMGAGLAEELEVATGFTLGVFWYDL